MPRGRATRCPTARGQHPTGPPQILSLAPISVAREFSTNRAGCGGPNSDAFAAFGSKGSGKEVKLPSPPPLRTVQAPFNAYGSSLRQRAFGKHAVGPIGLGVHLGVTTTVPTTEVAEAAPARIVTIPPTVLHCPLRRLADGSRPLTLRGSRLAFARGDLATPIRSLTRRPSLPPRSFTRSPIGSPCGWPTLAGGLRAYHVAS